MIRRYGKEQTKTWIRQGRGIYREMLSQVEDIGSDNPMAANIYMGFVFMAIWKAANGKITADDFRIVTREMMQNPLVRRIKGGVDMNKPEDLEKMKKMFHDMAAWQEAHPQYQEHSWDYHSMKKSIRTAFTITLPDAPWKPMQGNMVLWRSFR